MCNLTIVGLGNPDPKFAWSRHQAGFMVLDEVARERGATFQFRPDVNAHIATLPGNIRLVKPWTGMNESGFTVAALMRDMPLTSLLLVYDDIDIPLGAMKFALSASHGGHNGVRNVQEQLGTNNYSALRLGLGPKCAGDKYEFVTAPVAEALRDPFARCVNVAAASVPVWCEFGHARACNVFNGKKLLA